MNRLVLAVLLLGLTAAVWPAAPAISLAELTEAGLRARVAWLPYDAWQSEYRQYFARHVHDESLVLLPRAIVMHYTAGSTLHQTLEVFRHGATYDDGDAGRLPGHLSSHFIIDRDGTVYCCIPTNRRCRGAYGVNHVAISIEMVGVDEASILSDAKLMTASFRLVEVLCARYGIDSHHVWGHYQVGQGRRLVADYLDYGDSRHPDGYPAGEKRLDPGRVYMEKLWSALQAKGS